MFTCCLCLVGGGFTWLGVGNWRVASRSCKCSSLIPDKPGLGSPSYAGTPEAAPVSHHHRGLIASLLGPGARGRSSSSPGRTGSGLSRALPYSSRVFRLSPAAAALPLAPPGSHTRILAATGTLSMLGDSRDNHF